MQRLGRKGHPTYRVVVQDSRQTPTSGKVVASLGSYNPHTKASTLVKDKAELFMSNGAQPSDRVVKLFASEGLAMPGWVKQKTVRERTIRNADKLRKNRPAEPEAKEEPAAEVAVGPEDAAPITESTKVAEAPEAEAPENTSETPAASSEPPSEEVAVAKTDGDEEEPKPPVPGEDELPEDKAAEKTTKPATVAAKASKEKA